MADYKKYKVGITAKENWASDISFEQLDYTLWSVNDGGDGCGYIALKDNIGVLPNSDVTTWRKATEAGQSIYDLAIKYHHFVGTEEEFEAQYQQALSDAISAAQSASVIDTQVRVAEQQRVVAEQERVSAESQRASAEESRVSYEAQRSVNETGRVNAEDSRVVAENGRVVAESQRVIAESTRATNEENRMAEFGGMMRDAETAIGLVDAATTEAENVDATIDGMIVTITDRHGVSKSVNIGFDIYRTYGSVAAMNADAANVENGKFVMIATLDPTSTENAQLWVRNSNAATSQNPFTFISDLDQASSAAWADWMENQKPIIEADHTTAVADHTQAVSDHTNATNDHAVAGQDHTTAGTDHTQAVSDSTRAGQDHSVAEQDHTRAEGDHTTASTDHSMAQSDHTTAGTDHTTASSDHTIASGDHTTALSDHDIASGDHTTAGTDHATAVNDHAAVEMYVDSLGAFDLSKYNAVGGVLATYADLSAAITALNALDSQYKYGGMSFKFVRTSDHKYVQYRYMGTATTGSPNPFLDTANWQGVDDKITFKSENIAKSGDVFNAIGYEEISISISVTYYGCISSQGTITPTSNERIGYSDFIQVDLSKHYIVSANCVNVMYAAYYTAANEESFISAQQYPNASGVITDVVLSVPSNAAYMRISVASTKGGDMWSFNEVELNNINEIRDKVNLLEPKVAQNETDINGLNERVDIIEDSIGYGSPTPISISVTYYGYIDSQGTVSPSSTERIGYSDFIQVDLSKHYIVSANCVNVMCAAYYTAANEESFISAQQYPNASGVITDVVLSVPSNAAYMRISVASLKNGTPWSFSFSEIINVGNKLQDLQSQIDKLPRNIINYSGIEKIGFLQNPNLFNADILFVPMYGQSYTTANDGGYKITESFDSNVFMMSGTSPVGVGGTSIVPLSVAANKELEIADFGDIFSRILKRYCWRNQDILVASFGHGSRSIMELSPNNGYQEGYHQYEDVFEPGVQNAVDAALNANKTICCPFILYLQGESDVVDNRSSAATPDSWCKGDKTLYKQYMSALKTSMQQTIMSKTGQVEPPIVIVYTPGNQSIYSLKCGIAQAFLELCEENNDMFCVGPYYYMTSMGAHLSPDGRRWQAELFAKQTFEILVRGEETSMKVKNAIVDGKDIVLNFKVPTPPLVFDTWTYPQRNNYGFMLYENNAGTLTSINIVSVKIINSVNIVLETNVDLTEKTLFVTYGNSETLGGGNVRDSGAWKSCYDYETNNDGTGHIVYIPKNKQGNPIVGENYPMQMWMPQFGIDILP